MPKLLDANGLLKRTIEEINWYEERHPKLMNTEINILSKIGCYQKGVLRTLKEYKKLLEHTIIAELKKGR